MPFPVDANTWWAKVKSRVLHLQPISGALRNWVNDDTHRKEGTPIAEWFIMDKSNLMKMDDLWVRGNRGNPILGNPQTEFPFSLVQQEVNVEDIYEVSSLSPESAARTDHQRCDICRYLRHRNQVRRNSRTVWRCLWGHGGVLPMGQKTHIPRTWDFWMILVCVHQFTSLDLKLGQKTKSGQGWTRPCFRPAAGCKDHILFAFLRTHRGEAISGAHYPFFACLEKNTHDLKHLHLHGNKWDFGQGFQHGGLFHIAI